MQVDTNKNPGNNSRVLLIASFVCANLLGLAIEDKKQYLVIFGLAYVLKLVALS